MNDKFFSKYHGDRLQKQMDEDMQDMIQEEARRYDQSGGQAPMRKSHPAYEEGDYFEWERHQQMLRTQHRKMMERESNKGRG